MLYCFAWGGVELRDASLEPVEGFDEMTSRVGNDERTVYVSPKVHINSSVIEEVHVIPTGTLTYQGKTETVYGVLLILTDQGAEKMREISRSRMSERFAIVVDGEILSLPVVRAEVGKHIGITASQTRAEAEVIKRNVEAALEKQ